MRKMNKKIILGIMLLFVILISTALTSAAVDTANLEASLVRYEPLPAKPGQYLTVYVKIENDYAYPAEDAAIRIKEEFPFSIVNVNDLEQDLGIIEGKDSYVAEFKLKVDSEAVVGTNILSVEYTQDKFKGVWKKEDISISIKPNDASLSITNVKTNPETISPGSEGNIEITIKNTAEITLRDLALQIGLTSSDGSDIPFIPTSVTEKRVGKINHNEIITLNFPLKAYPSATPGYYKLPLTTTFYDEEGTLTEQEDILGIIIKAEPELKIYVEEVKATKSTSGDVTFKFVNKGINDLKFLDVKIQESEEYIIQDSTERYIGDLNSDDYRSESFNLKLDEDETTVNIFVSYKDENNNVYESVQELVVNASTGSGEKSGPSWFTILLVITLLVIGTKYLLKKRKAKKANKK